MFSLHSHPGSRDICSKKNTSRWYSAAIINALILLASCIIFPSELAAANPIDRLSEIQEKIKTKLSEVKETQKKEQSIITTLESIDKNIKKKENDLRQYDNSIHRKQSEIERLTGDIQLMTGKLNDRRAYLKSRIRALHKQQYGGGVLVLVSAKDYQDLIRKSKYFSLLAYHDSKVVKRYGDDIEKIDAKKEELKNLYDNLKKSKNNALVKKKELENERIKKDDLLAVVRSEREAHEARITELKEASKRLQSFVRGLTGNQIPQSITGDGFSALEGNLIWPVSGELLIPGGQSYQFPLVKDGVEISAEPNEVVKAVAGGRVVYADFFKGYGNLIIIDHGSGYHSLYGNLYGFAIASGELLIEGMEVGKANKSESNDGYSVYFEIRHRGKPVDPVNWLKDQRKRSALAR